MTAYSFSQLIDYTRVSSGANLSAGTFVGSNGLIQNSPQSRNVLLYTQEFDNAAWVKSSVTPTANSVDAPDGTMTADTLTATGANGTTLQTYTAISAPYVYSVWLRRLTGTGNVQITVDGTTYVTVAVTTTWTRFNTILMALAGSRTAGVRIVTSGDAVYAWGAQLEIIPDASLTLGSELISSGVIGLIGSATAATYNTGTGAGSVTRGVDVNNQSFVQWSGLSGNYRANITLNSGTGVGIRSGNYAGSAYMTAQAGSETLTGYIPDIAGLITITSSITTATFTLNSFRQITGTVGMPTDYTRNVGGRFQPRFDYDPLSLQPRGILIEEQRANFLTYSEDISNAVIWQTSGGTIGADSTASPSGVTNADALTEDLSTGFHQTFQVYTAPATGPATFSVYVKANGRTKLDVAGNWLLGTGSFDLATGTVTGANRIIQALGNGWFRCIFSSDFPDTIPRAYAIRMLDAAGSQSYTGDGTSGIYIWGAQLEAGTFPTSYMPTVINQVTRTRDQLDIVAPMYAPWYNAAQGTLVAEFSFLPRTLTGTIQIVNNGNADGRWANSVSGSIRMFDGTNTATAGSVGVLGAVNKTASALSSSGMAISLNGVAPGTAAYDGAFGSEVALSIGGGSGTTISGHFRRLTYYPTRLSNSQLQALTA